MRTAALSLLLLCLALCARCDDCSWPGTVRAHHHISWKQYSRSLITQDEHALGSNLPDELEISGVTWSPVLQLLAAVGDEDALVVLTTNGTVIDVFRNASRGFGLEAITFGPPASQSLKVVYAAIEYPAAIVELDLTTGAALRMWNVTGFPDNKKYGMEALAFFPVNDTAGWFYAGSQLTGQVYVVGPMTFDADTRTSARGASSGASVAGASMSGNASLSLPVVASFPTGLGLDDLAALSYDAVHGHMWALFDRHDVAATLRNTTAITIDPDTVTNWKLDCRYDRVPGEGQEGICTAGTHGQYILLGQDRTERSLQLVRFKYA